MKRSAAALAICLVFAVVIGAYFFLVEFPVHQYQDATSYGAFFFIVIFALVGAARLPPIQMVDPKKQQLGEQPTSMGIYDPPYCDNCGVSTGKANYCPNCGVPTVSNEMQIVSPPLVSPPQSKKKSQPFVVDEKEDDFPQVESEPEEPQVTFKDARKRLVEVDIVGTAQVPQSQLQNMVITRVTAGRRTTNPNAEVKPVRQKRVKPITETPPPEPIDDSPLEKNAFER